MNKLYSIWIHLSLRQFNWVSMSKIPTPHFQIDSWAIVSLISFLINVEIVYVGPIYLSLDKRIWFTTLFFHFFFSQNFFVKLWLILSQLELSRTKFTKCTLSILIGNCGHTIFSCFINSFFMWPSLSLKNLIVLKSLAKELYPWNLPSFFETYSVS